MHLRAINPSRRHLDRSCSRGFTLIELLITVVIAGILLAVALPAFQDSVRKGRRSDAFAALSALQQAQERWRGNNAAYTTDFANLGPASTTSSGGYYTLSAESPTGNAAGLATGYVLTAEGKGSTSQDGDVQCRKLSIKVSNGDVSYGGCGSCSTFTYTGNHACWSR